MSFNYRLREFPAELDELELDEPVDLDAPDEAPLDLEGEVDLPTEEPLDLAGVDDLHTEEPDDGLDTLPELRVGPVG